MNNGNKYDRAKAGAGPNATPKQILAYYDKLGGCIQDENGDKVNNGPFWEEEKRRLEAKRTRRENWKWIEKITHHPIVAGLLVVAILWLVGSLFKKDTYIGFYYPDASNLMNDIQSKETFNSLDACRNWAQEQVSIHNQNGSNYDYECGKNCNITGGKPYVCEETLE